MERHKEGRAVKKFEIKTEIVGSAPDEKKETRLLNRIISIDKDGWYYEADQRHADLIVRRLRLEEAKAVGTPGEDEKPWKEEEEAVPLEGRDAASFRALGARANYLALDRPDIQ